MVGSRISFNCLSKLTKTRLGEEKNLYSVRLSSKRWSANNLTKFQGAPFLMILIFLAAKQAVEVDLA